jgi:urease
MRFNDVMPRMRVDPERYHVEADGKLCTAEPAAELPLAQQYYVY